MVEMCILKISPSQSKAIRMDMIHDAQNREALRSDCCLDYGRFGGQMSFSSGENHVHESGEKKRDHLSCRDVNLFQNS